MAQTAWADGDVSAKERKILERVGRRAGLRPAQVADRIRAARHGEPPAPPDAFEAQSWVRAAVQVAFADGKISSAETAALIRLGTAHGLVAADVRLLITATRRRLYEQGRTELRRHKREKRGQRRK